MLQGVEIGVGFGSREPNSGNAKPPEIGDEAHHIQLGDMGSTDQGEITVTGNASARFGAAVLVRACMWALAQVQPEP